MSAHAGLLDAVTEFAFAFVEVKYGAMLLVCRGGDWLRKTAQAPSGLFYGSSQLMFPIQCYFLTDKNTAHILSSFFFFSFTEILATLRGHSGLVKGLTWDPVGKYIASQADDRSLKVWRTLDWQLETSITKPFDEVTGDSLELSVSPCNTS